ncbi:MAG: AbgT family transporter [Gemmatimonadetes bacterium]|nr:AbgT family transporter [Gemmatimonadota bacterium]MBT8402515.1 AbgT family transporter [Gemmatimonadota bacterium]NNF37866.1 putative basic amino acid antiporter YfcC [Gemmatimonadota bacterium]NNK63050.1 putative basic amino acid antiporter YfcC [Gemmatimonadota bacterium]
MTAPRNRPVRALDTSLLVFSMIAAAAILTWLVPPGTFEKEVIEVAGAGTREVVVPGSFSRLDTASPQGVWAVLRAPLRGIVAAADIVAFVLIVGGAFAVLQATGAVDAGLHRLVQASRRSTWIERLIIPFFMILFSLGGAIFGMAEEVIPFVLVFVPLSLRLGYDAVVGVAIPMVGSGAGFAAAFLNPFTIGVAQGIAEVPLFSGIGVRAVLWLVTTNIAIGFVTLYAARIRRDPSRSVVADIPGLSAASGGVAGATAGSGDDDESGGLALTRRHGIVLTTFVLGLALLVVGVTRFGWYIEEIAGLFLGVGIVMGLIGLRGPGPVAEAFMDGARALVSTAIIIGLARGILVVLEDGQIVDTLLFAMAGVLEGWGSIGSAQGMFAVQTALNFFVPSGSGQAALTMPLMAPLADLTGLSRQVAVLAYQMGDGFTNLIVPTNAVLMGAITLGGVPWGRWARWIIPLQLVFFAVGLAALAVVVGLGLY